MTPAAPPRSHLDFRQSFAFFEKHQHSIIFLAILALGTFARTWEFIGLPPGLHQDEASIGVDAFYIYQYGIDRNGFSYPVHLVSWGSGQNAMYAYLLIPFLAVLGLKAWVIRIPILISGILTLPLIYSIAERVVDRRFGLLAMFCIAVSPWHILLSRWGLESNLLPFFFSLGFLFLLKTSDDWRWFLAANVCFGLCLYTYGTAYAAIPIFLGFATLVLLWGRTLTFGQLVVGFLGLGIVAAPIILFVLINLLKLDTLHLGLVSIPRLPVVSRFEGLGAMFQGNSTSVVQNYAAAFLNVMFFQDDFRSRNGFPPYGYFYGVTFLPALVGAVLFITNVKKNKGPTLLFLSWLLTAFILGVLQPVIINRINLIFIPLIVCVAYLAYWLGQRYKIVLPVTVLALLVAFGFFTRDYHGPAYRQEIGREFYEGLVPAIEFARSAQSAGSGPICVTNNKVYMPYIFVLYNEQMPPTQFIEQVEYVDPTEPLREVRSLGRYTFGLDNCQGTAGTSFILFENEKFPFKGDYRKKTFGNYIVYSPR